MLMLLLASVILDTNSRSPVIQPILIPGETILLKVLVYITLPESSIPARGVGMGPEKLMYPYGLSSRIRKSCSSASSRTLSLLSIVIMLLVGFWKLGITYRSFALFPSSLSLLSSTSMGSGSIPSGSTGTSLKSGFICLKAERAER